MSEYQRLYSDIYSSEMPSHECFTSLSETHLGSILATLDIDLTERRLGLRGPTYGAI